MSMQEINPAGAKELLDQDWVLVDVRSPQEYAGGHVPGAYNVPIAFRGPMGMQLNEGFVGAIQRHFASDAKLVLMCAAGVRSQHACRFLEAEGFEALTNMLGGMDGGQDASGAGYEPGWAQAGLPVTREAEPGRSWEELAGGGAES